jgi:hypothetical protein
MKRVKLTTVLLVVVSLAAAFGKAKLSNYGFYSG